MATEYLCDDGGLDGYNWDSKAVGLHLGAAFAKTTGAAVRGGVVPALGNPLGYALSSGLVGNLKAGTYILPNPNPALGAYELVMPVDTLLTHTTAGAQTRVDLIVAEVQDTGTSASKKRFYIVTGAAGAGVPTLPAVVGNGAVAKLAEVTINASSTVLNAIVDRRTYTVAPNGIATVDGAFGTPALAASYPPNTPIWDPSAKRLMFRDSGSGLIHPTPIGVQRDIGTWAASVAVPAGIEYTLGTPVLQADSVGATASASGGDFYLPSDSGVFDIQANFYNNDPAGFSGQFRIVRSVDDYTLGTNNEGGALGTSSVYAMGVQAAYFPRITVKILNTSSGARTFTTTVRIARKQSGL